MSLDYNKQLKFVELYEQGLSNKEIAEKMKVTVNSVIGKKYTLESTRKMFKEKGITECYVLEKIKKYKGDIKKVSLEIGCDIFAIKRFVWVYPKLNEFVIKKPKKKTQKTINKVKKLITIDENYIPEEKNLMRKAKEILGNSLTYDDKIGYKINGQIVSTLKIMQITGLDNEKMYN